MWPPGFNTAGFITGYRGSPSGNVDLTGCESQEIPRGQSHQVSPRDE
jgi:TPP-dependent indolepyruvate ferredoxin oxidoreductase alpha subunit